MDDYNPYSPPSEIPLRRGGTRRIVGWMTFSLATVLTVRVIWMAATWNDLREVEFNRIVVLGTFGVVLMLFGCGLVFSARRAAIQSDKNSNQQAHGHR